MAEQFDKDFWEDHWDASAGEAMPANPALETELSALRPGTALEAGSGEGAEAGWLAERGWRVTAVDIAAAALERAAQRVAGDIEWIEADLTTWEPPHPFDLVTSFYAHPTGGQLAFYERLSRWVAPGGTLLLLGHAGGHAHASASEGHGHASAGEGHDYEHPARAAAAPAHGPDDVNHEHPAEAVVDAASIRALFNPDEWTIHTAETRERNVGAREGGPRMLRDVVFRASRR